MGIRLEVVEPELALGLAADETERVAKPIIAITRIQLRAEEHLAVVVDATGQRFSVVVKEFSTHTLYNFLYQTKAWILGSTTSPHYHFHVIPS